MLILYSDQAFVRFWKAIAQLFYANLTTALLFVTLCNNYIYMYTLVLKCNATLHITFNYKYFITSMHQFPATSFSLFVSYVGMQNVTVFIYRLTDPIYR